MRFFTACLASETNSFASRPTTMADFEAEGIRRDSASTADPGLVMKMIGALREEAAREGHELLDGLAAVAAPGGPVEQPCYEALRDELLAGLTAALPLDGAVLILHGSMVAEGELDCEGDLLAQARAIVGGHAAIGVVLDPHCSFTAKMRRHADVLVAFKHYPHIDTAERAREAWRLTVDTAAGRIRPVTAAVDCHVTGLWPTTREPMQSFVQRLQALEGRDGVLSVSFAHGFPWSDVPEGGARIWVIADGDESRAQALAEKLAREVWAMRADSAGGRTPMAEAIARVAAWQGERTLVLADAADNPGGGADGNSSFLMQKLLARRINRCAVAGLVAPDAVKLCAQAGVGGRLVLDIGEPPIRLDVKVMAYAAEHRQSAFGSSVPVGPSAWLRTDGGLDLVLISQRQQVLGTDLLTGLGLDWTRLRAVVLKSAQHFHAAFAPLAGEVIYVDTPGLLSTDFATLPYRHRSLDYYPRIDKFPQ